jgi:hypothetical protein
MNREALLELHFIAHFDNMVSICRTGILSHNRAESICHRSVASEIIQNRRRSKSVPRGKPLHDYANLYFHGRNPMLFKLKHEYGHAELCILSIRPEVLDINGVIITSCNAASDYVLFEPAPDGLDIVDKELVYARYWTDPDQFEKWRRASIKCAEVLVPDCVDVEFIDKAYVSCRDSKMMLERILRESGLSLNVVIDTDLFFG